MVNFVIEIVKFYQKFCSFFLPRCCRFYPSCSQYAISAFKKYGFFKGGVKGFLRILQCSFLSRGGYDPLT